MSKKPFLIIFLTVFIDLVGFGIIIPLNPYLARNFGADALAIGLLMTVYSAMQFIMSPIWGSLSDKYGRRPIILISLFGAAASHLIFAFSPNFALLFFARFLAGVFGGNISTAMAYIADVTEAKDRSKGMGLIGAAFGLGFVLGPFLGGLFAIWGQQLGTAPPFGESFAAVMAAVICFLNFLLAIRFLPESLKVPISEKRVSRFKKIKEALAKPVIGRLIFIYFLSSLAMAHMEASLFLYVQDLFRWDLKTASFGFAYVGLIMVFTQGYLVRKYMAQLGERTMALIGTLLASLGLGLIGFSHSVSLLAVAVTLLGVGVGLSNPSISGAVSVLTSRKDQGGVLGVNQSFSALGRIIGPALGGWFYRDISKASPFLVAGALMFLGFVMVFVIRKQIPDPNQKKSKTNV